MSGNKGKLAIIGLGPGGDEHITSAALSAINEACVVVGYKTYIKLIKDRLDGKEVVQTGMTEEIGRARVAVDRARAGENVAIVSSGDAGVYGMASLVFEALKEAGWKRGESPEVSVIPGVTAISACASLVGAPVGHDFCAISLSDLLTPWGVIAKRIDAAASADFVIVLYNPASGKRTRQIVEAREIIKKYRAGATPVAVVKSAYRDRQKVEISTLDELLNHDIGMLTTVIVGCSNTYVYEGAMITPRGYDQKYEWDGSVLAGQTPGDRLITKSGDRK
ncbi:Cobalt-precorrin-3 C(17)-methyltransferase [hydrothermal vent metagenome]|uniref:Cobalt-precorrin-3 C(17)-methyltransferase n=1 Tax=hydrothermal vent metagenome TaxID=652676 RepID=A0A3B1C019_9ZZZZ